MSIKNIEYVNNKYQQSNHLALTRTSSFVTRVRHRAHSITRALPTSQKRKFPVSIHALVTLDSHHTSLTRTRACGSITSQVVRAHLVASTRETAFHTVPVVVVELAGGAVSAFCSRWTQANSCDRIAHVV